jgi:hypothetical protein
MMTYSFIIFTTTGAATPTFSARGRTAHATFRRGMSSMKCLNCRALLAPGDTACPFCRTPAVFASSRGAPASSRDGKLVEWARQSRTFKWGCGGVMLLGSGLAMLVGLALALVTQKTSEVGPKAMTEAELVKIEDAKQLQGTWIAYDSPQSIETGTELGYMSALKKDQIKSRFILVRVGRGWMIAEVGPRFSGNHFVGTVTELWTSPLGKKIIEDIRRRRPAETALLVPYYLAAEKTYEQGVRGQYVAAGGVGFIGLLFFLFSFKVLRARPQGAA